MFIDSEFGVNTPAVLDNPSECHRSYASTAFPDCAADEIAEFYAATEREPSDDDIDADYHRWLARQAEFIPPKPAPTPYQILASHTAGVPNRRIRHAHLAGLKRREVYHLCAHTERWQKRYDAALRRTA